MSIVSAISSRNSCSTEPGEGESGGAAHTVNYRLRHEQGAIYKSWRTAWDARLATEQCGLMKFIDDDRREEVHDSGSSRNVAQEGVKFPIGTHHIDGGVLTISGIPTCIS
jgi:hypothetical protein